MINLHKKT